MHIQQSILNNNPNENSNKETVQFKDISVAVIVPIYKPYSSLSQFEKFSLGQCFNVLSEYLVVFICPYGLDVSDYSKKYERHSILIQKFDDLYFENIEGYNALMLSPNFYERFLEMEYILIYQLDAFVFEDQLRYWCNKGYDYIGAPWITTKTDGRGFKPLYKKWLSKKSYEYNHKNRHTNIPAKEQFYNKVGNGGFSLRRVKKILDTINEMKEKIEYFRKQKPHFSFNEDAFFSLEANRDRNRLKIPDFRIAIHFSIEFVPDLGFKLTNGNFPFGCHDWDNHLSFWKEKFLERGINLPFSQE